jgi:pantothenate kinase
MTFVKSFQWLKGFQSTYHWKLFTKVIKRISVNIPLEALHKKSLKGFQSTYHWKLFTKVIKRISVNIPLEALH